MLSDIRAVRRCPLRTIPTHRLRPFSTRPTPTSTFCTCPIFPSTFSARPSTVRCSKTSAALRVLAFPAFLPLRELCDTPHNDEVIRLLPPASIRRTLRHTSYRRSIATLFCSTYILGAYFSASFVSPHFFIFPNLPSSTFQLYTTLVRLESQLCSG